MKLANGNGSVICLDKTGKKRRKPWTIRITVGWKDGKQQRKYLGYYATQTEALIALAEYHKSGIDIDVTKLTLGEVYDQWIKRKEQTLSQSALNVCDMTYKRFGNLSNKPMREIKKVHLQNWLDGIDLKPGSKAKIRSVVHQLFEYAQSYDIVDKNYAKGLEIPEKIEKTGAIFTEDEIKTLWEHRDNQMVQYLLILIYTGMRIGELLDITADNVHLDEQYMIGGNKTEAGRNRVIPIHDKIKPMIEQNLTGKHLVASSHGGSLTYNAVVYQFKKLMDEFGMKHKIHDTRKTAVSIMHSAGIPIETVRMIVGHAAKGVTEQIYLYKQPHELVEVINTIEIPY